MTVYGYFHCSTNLQDEERQIRALKDAKIDFLVEIRSQGLLISIQDQNYLNY